jgi:hypothetical protein
MHEFCEARREIVGFVQIEGTRLRREEQDSLRKSGMFAIVQRWVRYRETEAIEAELVVKT